jgi:Secretion system C-terminal sorting domain
LPNGEICMTHITETPDEMPGNVASAGNYYVVDNYGTNANIATLTSLELLKAGTLGGTAAQYSLYARGSNAFGTTWGNALCAGTSIVTGANGSVLFGGATAVTSLGQFVITGPYDAVGIKDLSKENLYNIYPNPSNGFINFENKLNENFAVNIYSLDGKIVANAISTNYKCIIDCTVLSNGIYYYQINNNGKISNGKIEVKR